MQAKHVAVRFRELSQTRLTSASTVHLFRCAGSRLRESSLAERRQPTFACIRVLVACCRLHMRRRAQGRALGEALTHARRPTGPSSTALLGAAGIAQVTHCAIC